MTATIYINEPLSTARARVREGKELTEADRQLLKVAKEEPAVDWRCGMQCLPAGAVVLAFLVRRDNGEIVEVAEPCYLTAEEEQEYTRALAEARAFLAAEASA